jgi:hypothetical protein
VRALAILVVLVAVAGCGGGDNGGIRLADLPPECVGDSAGLVKALAAAPGRVLVDGRPISGCFTRDQDGAELQALGTGLLAAAQQLGDRARGGDNQAALELGYLIGAARKGANRYGLADEMLRRLEAETSGLGQAQAAYTRGLRAGLAQG